MNRLKDGAALVLAAVSLVHCTGALPDVELTPPEATLTTSGDYRIGTLELLQPDAGLDLDQDTTPDNNFPYLLDGVYAAVETVVVEQLTEVLDDEAQAQQTWTVASQVLMAAGLPLSADAYRTSLSDAVRTTTLNYLCQVDGDSSRSQVVVQSGQVTSIGYQTDALLATMLGDPAPASIDAAHITWRADAFPLQYTGAILQLSLRDARLDARWTAQALDEGALAGAVLLDELVANVVVALEDVDLPVDSDQLEVLLRRALLAMETPTGEAVFDLELDDQDAVSVGYSVAAGAVQLLE